MYYFRVGHVASFRNERKKYEPGRRIDQRKVVEERKKNIFTRRFWEEWRKKSLKKRIRDNSYFSSVCFEFREF